MTPNRRIFLNIVATPGGRRSRFSAVGRFYAVSVGAADAATDRTSALRECRATLRQRMRKGRSWRMVFGDFGIMSGMRKPWLCT